MHFHKISPKHLDRYVAEFAGRHNIRPLDTQEFYPGDEAFCGDQSMEAFTHAGSDKGERYGQLRIPLGWRGTCHGSFRRRDRLQGAGFKTAQGPEFPAGSMEQHPPDCL